MTTTTVAQPDPGSRARHLTPVDIGILRRAYAALRAAGYKHDATQIGLHPREHRWQRDHDGNTIYYETGSGFLTVVVRSLDSRPLAHGRDRLIAYVTSATQAVNLLADIGILPRELHSLHTALVAEQQAHAKTRDNFQVMAESWQYELSGPVALVQDDPMTYDRADTEPGPVPVPDGVEVYAVSGRFGDVGKCPQCGRQSRSYSRGCLECGFRGSPVVVDPSGRGGTA